MLKLLNNIGDKKAAIFFDFDNTVTLQDTIDSVLIDYSTTNNWLKLEKEWKSGKIGSRKCLKGQMKDVRITKGQLNEYLATIKLDPYFKKIALFLESKKIKPIILSDNFDYFIKYALKTHGIKGIKVFSNSMTFSGNRILTKFPFRNNKCLRCAHCKKKNMFRNTPVGAISIYIGDGLSDVCPAKHADIVFAKDHLIKILKRKKVSCVPFKSLKDVYNKLRKDLKCISNKN